MSEWMKLYLALCAAIALMVSIFQGQIDAPQPVDTGYPVATNPAPRWVDGCGVFHSEPIPQPFPTEIPVDQISQVCGR